MFSKIRLRDYNYKLFIYIVCISVVGIFAIGSADESLQSKQLIGVIFGLVLMVVISFFNYSFFLKFYWIMYVLNLALLLAVLFVGKEGNGAQRWLKIGGLGFQPSELAKILLILFFAKYIMKYKEKLNSLLVLGSCVLLILIPIFLIFKQPDLSTSIMIALIFCVIIFTGGLSLKIIFSILAVAVPAIAIIVTLALQPEGQFLEEYQKNRIMSFIHPEEYANEEALQQLNSVMAIGSGQLNGKGYKNNEITSVKNGNFYSEAQTDFIFAVIGEEFGFKGSVFVVVLLVLITLECFSVGRRAKDLSGQIICAGVGGLIGFQSFINIGVATFLLPNTGLPLPFVSNGLTSLLSLYMGIGFVLNIKLQEAHGTKELI